MHACRQAGRQRIFDGKIREGEASTKQKYLRGTLLQAACLLLVGVDLQAPRTNHRRGTHRARQGGVDARTETREQFYRRW